uniref:SSD domain-containing protein n=1 Tax=Parascaris univalens TaxID=6257 RepID=A0A914ZEG9_PARUN
MGLLVNNLFSVIGFTIGSRPLTFIFISLAIFAFSLLGPIFNLDVRMNLKSGFTRRDAPSAREIAAHVEFFGNRGTPWYMALFAVAQNGSILNDLESNELTTFYKYITQEMIIEYENQTLKYRDDLCEPFCKFNSQLWNILQYHSFFQLTYPLATIGPYKINVGKYLFNRTTNKNGVITGVGTVVIYFTTFINSTTKERHLELFEKGVLSKVREHNANKSNSINFVLHGAYSVTQEVQRGVLITAPYYLTGAALLAVFVLFAYTITSLSFNQFEWSKLALACAAIISPIIASITAIGFILLVGLHVNMLVLISPFLTLAIGVDDAFLLTNTWMRQRDIALQQNYSPAERLQLVFEKVGAAVAVTSFTNVLGFALGCIAPVPEIQLFCASVSLSMFMDLLFQLTLYSPLHVLLDKSRSVEGKYELVTKNEKQELTSGQKVRNFFATVVQYYAEFMASLWAEMILVGVLIGYLYISIRGILSLRTDMDGSMILPSDSQSNEGIRIMNEVVWPDFLGINYIIRNPPNFSDPIEYRKFVRMTDDVQSMDNAIGSHANLIWINDYLRYLANPGASKLDILFGWSGPEGNDTQAKKTGLDMSEFEMFINTDPYTGWKDGVRYKHDSKNRTVITQMLYIVGYKGTRSLSDKVRLLSACRKISSRYPQYNMVPFDTDSQLIDVIIAVPPTTFNTMTFTVAAMGIVFLAFSANIATAIVATLSVASICSGVLGMLHYWDCYLDPLTMVAVIMTAGLGVDFTAHIVFHYLMNEQHHRNNAKRIAVAFDGCALSALQAGLSTFLVMFPVLFAPVGVYTIIAKAIVLVVIIGLIHGLVLVPILLAALPNCLTGKAFCAERQLSMK